ncbi:MAG: hypothetical protein AAB415_01470 [Patescibacteria group bacterium]
MSIATIKDQDLRQIIKQSVAESVHDVFTDPDQGLELQNWVIERLEKIKSRRVHKTRSLAQVRKRLLA